MKRYQQLILIQFDTIVGRQGYHPGAVGGVEK